MRSTDGGASKRSRVWELYGISIAMKSVFKTSTFLFLNNSVKRRRNWRNW